MTTPDPANLPVENTKPADRSQVTSGPLGVANFVVSMFSTNERQRASPDEGKKTSHIRLVTIGVSHFCEKSRWALDLLEAKPGSPYYYTEDPHCPGFHSFASLPACGYATSQTPMIVMKDDASGDAKTVHPSDAINKLLMPELYHSDNASVAAEIEELEQDFGKRVGATARCFAYHHILSDLKTPEGLSSVTQLCANPSIVSKVENRLFSNMLDKGLGKGILKSMSITAESAAASEESLRNVFAEVSQRLEESGGDYIMDKKGQPSLGFTAADLTFAALAAPVIVPKQLGAVYPEEVLQKLPAPYQTLQNELRQTTAGKHVVNMYSKHRLEKDATGSDAKVELKVVDRNCYPWQGWFGAA